MCYIGVACICIRHQRNVTPQDWDKTWISHHRSMQCSLTWMHGFPLIFKLVHTQFLHMNTLMHIHSLENGPSEAQALKLTVMQRGTGWEWACKHITDCFVSCNLTILAKQVRDAKLTPYYSLITVAVSVLHECWHNMWNCAGLFRPFMYYKADVSQQWHFLVFWEVHCTLRSEWLNRKWSFLREVYSGTGAL